LPSLAAEAVQADPLALASVAAEELDILDRDVELVAARIFERDAVVRYLADGNLRQPFVAPDSMISVDNQVPGRERRQLLVEGRGGLALLAPAHDAVAEHVLLGEHRHLGGGEAEVERQNQKRGLGLRSKRF